MDEQAQLRERNMEIVRREMERKSKDIWRVYNPLDHEFRFQWDSRWFKVPAKQSKDIEQFLATHYFKKISEYMIGQQITLRGEDLLKKRRKQGMPEFLNKYDENKAVWDNTPRQNDEDLLTEIRDIVIVGLVEEYGLDLPENTGDAPKSFDPRSPHDRLFSEIKRLAPDEEESRPVKPLKKDLVEEVTSE